MSEADRQSATARPRVPLVQVRKVSKLFPIRSAAFARPRFARAVDGVGLSIHEGETFGLIGESGSGKSTLGRTLVRLTDPTYGRIAFDGTDITRLSRRALRPYRKHMQMTFQEPAAGLNPLHTVGGIIADAIGTHRLLTSKSEIIARTEELLKAVGLEAHLARRYPREVSSGECQRIGLARVLAVEPRFIVCDQPTSVLDGRTRTKVFELLETLQRDRRLSYLLISDDLGAIRHISHRVGVMYHGRIVEVGPTGSVYERRHHPYTRALLSALPEPIPKARQLRILLEGEPPSPAHPPSGCAFHPRCPRMRPGLCDVEVPALRQLHAGSRHRVACHEPHV